MMERRVAGSGDVHCTASLQLLLNGSSYPLRIFGPAAALVKVINLTALSISRDSPHRVDHTDIPLHQHGRSCRFLLPALKTIGNRGFRSPASAWSHFNGCLLSRRIRCPASGRGSPQPHRTSAAGQWTMLLRRTRFFLLPYNDMLLPRLGFLLLISCNQCILCPWNPYNFPDITSIQISSDFFVFSFRYSCPAVSCQRRRPHGRESNRRHTAVLKVRIHSVSPRPESPAGCSTSCGPNCRSLLETVPRMPHGSASA